MLNLSFIKKGTNIKGKYKRIILFSLTFLLAYILLVSAVAPKKYNLNEGDIAKNDIKAPRETIDEEASQQVLQAALEKVDKQYTLKSEVQLEAVDKIKSIFEKVESLNATTLQEKEKIASLKKVDSTILTDDNCKMLLQLSNDELTKLQEEIVDLLNEVYSERIEDGNEDALNTVKNLASDKILSLKLDSNLTTFISNLVLGEIKPNFFYDEEKTDEKIKEVQKNTPKVVIKKNQIVVKEGEPVTAEQIAILNDLGLLNNENSGGYFLIYLALAITLALVLALQYYYIYRNYREVYSSLKKLTLISIVNSLSLLLVRGVSIVSPFLIPVACAPLLLTLLINYKISLFVSSMNVIIIAALVNFDPQIILLSLSGALIGSTILRKMQQRNDILIASAIIAGVNAIITFSTGVLLSSNIKEVFLNSLFSAIGVVFAGILTIGFLPLLEATFDIITTLKLLELSNPNNELLKRLLMEAPGTYHHSMVVGNLAEMAAEEVGANPIITRVGAYYHDVGKTTRPYFFKENQLGKENPHDKITPNLSTLIITSHVKDGIELAKEHNVPKIIQDIIAEHHGTTLVKYFYYTAKNSSENPEEVKEEDFRYPGPIPSTKEAGIIMLADSVEAAVRSISEPTKGKIEEMVNNIIKDKLNDGQLDNCDLTLKDLGKIRRCFLKALTGIYHQRIEYPTEKKEN